MRAYLIIMITGLLAGCTSFPSAYHKPSRAPAGSMSLSIAPDGDMDTNGVARIKLIFRNVSDQNIYFPTRFRGGVTYVDEIRNDPGPEIIETEDSEGEIIEEIEIIEDEGSMPRSMVMRGCGGRGCTSQDDFILLTPGETYTQNTTVRTEPMTPPLSVKLSRAIYSSDVKLPNMWLGNITSHELFYE